MRSTRSSALTAAVTRCVTPAPGPASLRICVKSCGIKPGLLTGSKWLSVNQPSPNMRGLGRRTSRSAWRSPGSTANGSDSRSPLAGSLTTLSQASTEISPSRPAERADPFRDQRHRGSRQRLAAHSEGVGAELRQLNRATFHDRGHSVRPNHLQGGTQFMAAVGREFDGVSDSLRGACKPSRATPRRGCCTTTGKPVARSSGAHPGCDRVRSCAPRGSPQPAQGHPVVAVPDPLGRDDGVPTRLPASSPKSAPSR